MVQQAFIVTYLSFREGAQSEGCKCICLGGKREVPCGQILKGSLKRLGWGTREITGAL